jgi:hypothetical protein
MFVQALPHGILYGRSREEIAIIGGLEFHRVGKQEFP